MTTRAELARQAAQLVERLRVLCPAAADLSADSRLIRPGDVFLAFPGQVHDGRHYIAQAVQAGAAAVVWEADGFEWPAGLSVPNLAVPGLRALAAALAVHWYGDASAALWMCGVTGTNGKTSIAHWLGQGLDACGRRCAVLGTLGNGLVGALAPSSHTTPDCVSLQRLLAGFRAAGAQAVAMEVSSHGLDQGRVAGVHFDVAILSNLSRDHLDYHGDMASYAQAKAKLFGWPGLKWAVLNLDDDFGAALHARLQGTPVKCLGYGLRRGEIRASMLELTAEGLRLSVVTPWGQGEIESPLLGEFNAYNLLAVLGGLLASGLPLDQALAQLAQLKPVAGRLQTLRAEAAPTVVVDYAHTPDALEKTLKTLRPLATGRLWCVFGAGGGRDRGKRPLMGACAAALADRVIVTSDNPRFEDPAAIIADILAGMPPGQTAITDRAEAIRTAVTEAATGDVVLIAGKGHEDYQEIHGVRHPFSDVEVARSALASRGQSASADAAAPAVAGEIQTSMNASTTDQDSNRPLFLLSEAARAIGAATAGGDVGFERVETDTRRLSPGCLFVALKGERYDGHAFIAEAIAKGAAAVMIDAAHVSPLTPHPSLIVEDTRLALGRLAAWHRGRMPTRILAVTGSNGKTTVKEMTAAILRAAAGEAAVLATEGNLNNDIGVPLTLLKLTPAHRFGVIEMGMNHAGELAYLTRLARPDVALVNNAQRAHLEGLTSVAAVARAKGEIYEGLAADGIALVNGDDPYADLWLELNAGRRILRFGLGPEADVRAEYELLPEGARLRLHTPQGLIETQLAVPGLHNVRNAAAAAAAALALGVTPASIAQGLAAYRGVKGRLQVHPCILGARLIDDTYNANPDSVGAAIQVLAALPGRRILVLGDMGELGAGAAELHREIGRQAKAAGIDRLLALGELSVNAVQGFGPGAMHFERIEELLAEIENALGPEVTVLVKGSRFMRMERVVQSFKEEHLCS
ncbi:MAG: bifunctional UDP-N-acetylmuramoyl-L-alanyl-D-glutamate--2,6-diaminopimelate ligase MurE/UDP-N-acetylmuramoyl-tripeptide--D-alanyl-D-alanine ligase MurF [Thiobacillaceae bacterium]